MELNKGSVNSANTPAEPCCSDGYVPVHHGQRDTTHQGVLHISLRPITRFTTSPHHSVLTSLIYCMSSRNWFHQNFISEKEPAKGKKKCPWENFLWSKTPTILHKFNHAHCLKKEEEKKEITDLETTSNVRTFIPPSPVKVSFWNSWQHTLICCQHFGVIYKVSMAFQLWAPAESVLG